MSDEDTQKNPPVKKSSRRKTTKPATPYDEKEIRELYGLPEEGKDAELEILGNLHAAVRGKVQMQTSAFNAAKLLLDYLGQSGANIPREITVLFQDVTKDSDPEGRGEGE